MNLIDKQTNKITTTKAANTPPALQMAATTCGAGEGRTRCSSHMWLFLFKLLLPDDMKHRTMTPAPRCSPWTPASQQRTAPALSLSHQTTFSARSAQPGQLQYHSTLLDAGNLTSGTRIQVNLSLFSRQQRLVLHCTYPQDGSAYGMASSCAAPQ